MLCWQVHEGPQGISPRIASAEFGLVPGMIVSNEVRPNLYASANCHIVYGVLSLDIIRMATMESELKTSKW